MQNQQNFGGQGKPAHHQQNKPDYDPEVENIDDIINFPFTSNYQNKSGNAAKMALAKISQSELELMEDD